MPSRLKLGFGYAAALAVFSLGILFASRLATAQPMPLQGAPPDTAQVWPHDYNDPLVTEQETEDSYAIYPMLLKDELKEWHLKRYAIEEWTGDMRGTPSDPLCLQPVKEQKATYQDLFQDFLRRHRSRHQLAYRFDLIDYLLLAPQQSDHVRGLLRPVPALPLERGRPEALPRRQRYLHCLGSRLQSRPRPRPCLHRSRLRQPLRRGNLSSVNQARRPVEERS